MRMIPIRTAAMMRRKSKLIDLTLSWRDFEKYVVSVTTGRDVQAMKVQVRRFGEAIRESDANVVARSDFKPRTRNRTVVAIERRRTSSKGKTTCLGRQRKVQCAALARHRTEH